VEGGDGGGGGVLGAKLELDGDRVAWRGEEFGVDDRAEGSERHLRKEEESELLSSWGFLAHEQIGEDTHNDVLDCSAHREIPDVDGVPRALAFDAERYRLRFRLDGGGDGDDLGRRASGVDQIRSHLGT
jgi:hypothetical protein